MGEAVPYVVPAPDVTDPLKAGSLARFGAARLLGPGRGNYVRYGHRLGSDPKTEAYLGCSRLADAYGKRA